jgi:hypothetical protein
VQLRCRAVCRIYDPHGLTGRETLAASDDQAVTGQEIATHFD